MFDNKLFIDLLISPSKRIKHPTYCESAINKFKSLFEIVPEIDENYILPSRPNEAHTMCWVDVTTEDLQTIFLRLEKIQRLNA
jgi:hypothetical protein